MQSGLLQGPKRVRVANRPPGRTLVVVSNRLPIQVSGDAESGWNVRRSAGGLVSALEPVLDARGGIWVGWDGTVTSAGQRSRARFPVRAPRAFEVRPVSLTPEEHAGFYMGLCNQALWPALHGLDHLPAMQAQDWARYLTVNRRFAEQVPFGRSTQAIWVHDYHLVMLGRALRRRGANAPLGFFLHTPFPDPETLTRLPFHRELLQGLLSYDCIGFQTDRDRQNFDAAIDGLSLESLQAFDGVSRSIPDIGTFPISVDFDAWDRLADDPWVVARAAEIRRSVGERLLVLGVERLDPAKGTPQKLKGVGELLRSRPDLRGRFVTIQLVVPSREDLPTHRKLRADIEARVQEVDGDGEVIRYIYGEWDRHELAAHYKAADVLLVNSLRDGMNLVSKEFCAVNRGGTLVLSKEAGAAAELGPWAVLVDPTDHVNIAAGLRRAIELPWTEAERRMRAIRRHLRRQDVHAWARSFLRRLATARDPRPGSIEGDRIRLWAFR